MTVTIALAMAAVYLAVHLATVFLAAAHGRRSADARLVETSSEGRRIVLMRPVTGRDAFDEETLGSSFRQDWPEYEVIFCAPRPDDPGAALARRLMAENPQVKAQLFTDQRPVTGNPKLDNLWQGWGASDAPWVAMADSNLMLPPDYLTTLARCWTPGTGLVTSPAAGARAEGFWAALECAFLNGNQDRLQLASAQLGQGYAQGKSLFWNRAILEANGGLMPLGRWLAEDVASTKLVRAAGLKVRLAPRPFIQPIGRRSFRQVWDRQLRWARVRRDGFPAIFAIEFLNGPFLPAALLLAVGLWPWALALLAVCWLSEVWLSRAMGWPHGPRDLAAMALRDLISPALWGATFLKRGITWRGNDMQAPGAGAGPGGAAK